MQTISIPQFFDEWTEKVFCIHETLRSLKRTNDLIHEIIDIFKAGFELREVRDFPVKFRFGENQREPIRILKLTDFLVNMIFWKAVAKLDKGDTINSTFIINCRELNNKTIRNFINNKIIIPNIKEISIEELNKVICDLIHELAYIPQLFNVIMGMSINTESFINLANNHPEFAELIRTRPSPGMQPKAIETMLNKKEKENIEFLKTHPNVLQPMLNSGVGIKSKQLTEFMVMGGLKPDLDGNTIPIPIDSNFLYRGLDSISSYYIDAQSGKKSVIMNKTSMGISGHFASKVRMLAAKHRLSQTCDCCDTVRPVEFHIKNKEYLKRIDGRYYYKSKDLGQLFRVSSDKDTHLIGETIYMRDPSTCTCKDGICHICYGDLYYVNRDAHFNIGTYAATILTKPVEQKILSTKHLLTTNSIMLEFAPEFYKFFTLEANKIKLNPDFDGKLADWSLVIYKDYLYEIISMEEADFNQFTDVIGVKNKKTNEIIDFKELGTNQSLYISLDIASMFESKNDDYVEVPLNKIEDDMFIAIIIIENNELTKPLKNLMRLLDKKDHFDCLTVDDLVNRMCDLVIESDIKIQMNHCSVIIKGMLASTTDVLMPPPFNDETKLNDYLILTVSNAIMVNPSLTTSLAFQYRGKQLQDPLTNRKHGFSSFDALFSPELYKKKHSKY